MPGHAPWQVLAVGEELSSIETSLELLPRTRTVRVHHVDTYLEAREVLRTARPTCVLLTETLPDGDPLSLVAEWSDIPFIVVGSVASDAGPRIALESGAQDYLSLREIEPRILLRAIRYAVDRKLHERGLRALEHEDRLSSIGRLAASMAHEINNPAAFIAANLAVLASHVSVWETFLGVLHARRAEPAIADVLANVELPVPGEATTLVQESRVGVERVVGIVRQLSSFARRSDQLEPFTATSLNEVVDWACLLTRKEIRHHGRLELALSPDLPTIMARPGGLAQVVTNLLVNAAHALALGGDGDHVVRVSTRSIVGSLELMVEDTGPGFEPSVLRRVFEPFFTTKGKDGTGLGLSIANEIVQAHDGSMEIENRTDRVGARVVVRLPLGTAHVERHESARPSALPVEGRGLMRILVIDDEASIRRAYSRLLRPHEVVGEEASAALERVEAGDREFDLILCDLMMPDIDGIAVHRALARTAPELLERLVFNTGGAFREEVRAWLERTPVPVLPKPSSRDEILAIASARRAKRSER